MGRYFICSPIYYVNDRPHIGHAYTSLACDVLARWRRMRGDEVLFSTGTDEYGQKIEQAAIARKQGTKTFTDELSQQFRNLAHALNFKFDDFVRTTESRHRTAVTEMWRRLEKQGALYRDVYKGWYAVRDEAYIDESEVVTSEDGKRYAPSGAEVTWVEQPSYFFRLSDYQDRLLEHYRANPDFIMPVSRANEVISFVRSGLRDFSVSRTRFSWGVGVPNDPEHVIYVWLDALVNYLTVCGFPDETHERYPFWPAHVHIIGKDIIRFHAVYWPAILMAAGLPLPKHVFAHGWWTNEGKKISKSLGNVINPIQLSEEFGVDGLRYFLLRELPFGQDGDFRRQNLITRINDELGNDYGNLCQRVLRFVVRRYDSRIPETGDFRDEDIALLETARGLPKHAESYIQKQSYHKALETVFAVVSDANRYVDRCAPWQLINSDPQRAKTTLYVVLEAIRHITYCLYPFIPSSAESMLEQLGYKNCRFNLDDLDVPLPEGQKLGTITILFPRVGETS